MFKKNLLLGLIIAATALPSFNKAQDSNEIIEYGKTVTGEITNREFEIPFDFTGKKGDVIIIEMNPVDSLGDLNSPEIILLGEDGDVIGDTSGSFSFGSTLLATQLDADGTYTILATRNDGRAGDSVGEFTLALIQPTLLEMNEPIEASLKSSGGTNYYLIEGGNSPIALSYTKTDGEYAPELSINVIDEYFSLDSIINFNGDELNKAQVTLPTGRNTFIVKIGEALFDFNFETVTAEYELIARLDE